MLFLYNTLQLIFLALFWPIVLFVILLKEKYRSRMIKRLGFGLAAKMRSSERGSKKTIWVHALSVGEVTSAVVFVQEIRKQMTDAFIVLTVSTKSGSRLANELLTDQVDLQYESPLDLLPVVRWFVKTIRPDIFILVETDFWPNLLSHLKKQNIPLFLINGRISRKSFSNYSRFGFFFQPLFNIFTRLCMQTGTDKENMKRLGIDEGKILTLGNLKYDTQSPSSEFGLSLDIGLAEQRLIWICGSTHPGEEEILLSAYVRLREKHPELFLIIAPRDIDRTEEIKQLGLSKGLKSTSRSQKQQVDGHYFLLDTIGELAAFYHLADIGFIGGSLVDEGGHNPIEAALAKIPVLFGPHMEDFEEISSNLVLSGGAFVINDEAELVKVLDTLLQSESNRRTYGKLGYNDVQQQKGVSKRHLDLITGYLK